MDSLYLKKLAEKYMALEDIVNQEKLRGQDAVIKFLIEQLKEERERNDKLIEILLDRAGFSETVSITPDAVASGKEPWYRRRQKLERHFANRDALASRVPEISEGEESDASEE